LSVVARAEGRSIAIELSEKLRRRELNEDQLAISSYFLGSMGWSGAVATPDLADCRTAELRREVFYFRTALLKKASLVWGLAVCATNPRQRDVAGDPTETISTGTAL